MVDIHSTRYAIARRYMIRLRRDDFEDPHELAQVRRHLRPVRSQEFREEFEYLIEDEPPALVLESFAGADAAEPAAAAEPEARPAARRSRRRA